jgi:hypothetical protein
MRADTTSPIHTRAARRVQGPHTIRLTDREASGCAALCGSFEPVIDPTATA